MMVSVLLALLVVGIVFGLVVIAFHDYSAGQEKMRRELELDFAQDLIDSAERLRAAQAKAKQLLLEEIADDKKREEAKWARNIREAQEQDREWYEERAFREREAKVLPEVFGESPRVGVAREWSEERALREREAMILARAAQARGVNHIRGL